MKRPSIGIVGMGWVGGTYAKVLRKRGYNPVCYSLEPEYAKNKDAIRNCDFVLICVPTPYANSASDWSELWNVYEALDLVGNGKTAIIKSTVLPRRIQHLASGERLRRINIVYCPEFLSEATAYQDASNPDRMIVGLTKAMKHKKRNAIAQSVIEIFPPAKFTLVCSVQEAALIKYARNVSGYVRVVLTNILYQMGYHTGCDWDRVASAISADPLNGPAYTKVFHKKGRGAGGSCFVKDFASFRQHYLNVSNDLIGGTMLLAIEQKNIDLLRKSGKSTEFLEAVYGR
jgi:UDPglucose 6-dehydrogenase